MPITIRCSGCGGKFRAGRSGGQTGQVSDMFVVDFGEQRPQTTAGAAFCGGEEAITDASSGSGSGGSDFQQDGKHIARLGLGMGCWWGDYIPPRYRAVVVLEYKQACQRSRANSDYRHANFHKLRTQRRHQRSTI